MGKLKGGLFAKLLKGKPGGTMLGNMIRGVARQYSGGLLGNGMMLRARENAATDDEYTADLANRAGAGIQAMNDANPSLFNTNKPADMSGQIENGATFQWLKSKFPLIALGLGVFVGAIFAFKKMFNK